MKRRMLQVVVLVLAVLPYRAAAAQQESAGGAHQSASRAALYAGFTTNGGTEFTLGADFLRHQPDSRLGGGAFADLVFARDLEFLFGVTLNYFVSNLVLETGPGIAILNGPEFLWRIGAGLELLVPKWSITPKAYVDLVAGTTFVGLGVAVGKNF